MAVDLRTPDEMKTPQQQRAHSLPAKKQSHAWLLSFPIGAAIIWGFSMLPTTDNCNNSVGAQTMAEEYVREHLKAPSTAVFPWITSPGVSMEKIEECKFLIKGYVDAENSFGAMIRTTYTVEVQPGKKRGEWMLSKLTMDSLQ